MGTVRSVVEIDVKSDAFKEYQKNFEAYQKAVNAMPGVWREAGQAAAGMGESAAAAGQESAKALAAMTASLGVVVARQGDVGRAGADGTRMFQGMARATGDVLKNITDITFQLVKWGLMGGVLGVAAGGFGAGRLAEAGAGLRRASGMLGTSPGQLRAARDIYGTQIDVDSVLGNIASVQADPTQRWKLNALGINGARMNASPGDLLPDVLADTVRQFKAHGGNAAAYQAFGLDAFMDLPTARELAKLPEGELDQEARQYAGASQQLGLDDETLRHMKELNQEFDKIKDRIETVLINGLNRLAPNLEKLSDSIVNVLERFINNPKMGEYIDQFGEVMKQVATYLNSDKFKGDIDAFVENVHRLAHPFDAAPAVVKGTFGGIGIPGTHMSLDWLGHKIGAGLSTLDEWTNQSLSSAHSATDRAMQMIHANAVSQLEQQKGLPAGMLDAIWAQESSRGANAAVSSAGAFGDFQFLPETGKQYGVTPDSNFSQQASGAANYLSDLMKYYRGDVRKALAAYFDGQGNLDKIIKGHPLDWENYLPPKTASYLSNTAPLVQDASPSSIQAPRLLSPMNGNPPGVRVDITNQPGADINVSTTQVVH